jgi:hypothetical protein
MTTIAITPIITRDPAGAMDAAVAVAASKLAP